MIRLSTTTSFLKRTHTINFQLSLYVFIFIFLSDVDMLIVDSTKKIGTIIFFSILWQLLIS